MNFMNTKKWISQNKGVSAQDILISLGILDASVDREFFPNGIITDEKYKFYLPSTISQANRYSELDLIHGVPIDQNLYTNQFMLAVTYISSPLVGDFEKGIDVLTKTLRNSVEVNVQYPIIYEGSYQDHLEYDNARNNFCRVIAVQLAHDISKEKEKLLGINNNRTPR